VNIFRLAILHALITSALISAPPVINRKADAILAEFEKAFASRIIGSLQWPVAGDIKVTIIHSLIEPPAGKESARFRSFKAVEAWLRAKQRSAEGNGGEIYPNLEVRPRSFVHPYEVVYDTMGISHNTLYVSRIKLARVGSSLTIKEIELYDGD